MLKIHLAEDEQVTFITKKKAEYDIISKNWGFYVTPSINFRLKKQGFKIALVKNKLNRIYIMAVEKKNISKFKKYCKEEDQKVILWLDKNNLKIKSY